MQLSTLSSARDQYRDPSAHSRASFFQVHAVGEILRGLVFSSVLWMLLAVAIYGVYRLVLGSN